MQTQDSEGFARFYFEAVRNAKKSEAAGRDIFDQKVFVSVTFPGRRDFEFRGEASDDHKKRFARAWDAFRAAETEPMEGTPLKLVPIMSVDAIAHLSSVHIHTLEAFAALTADDLKAFPAELQSLHKRALAYLDAAQDKGALAARFAKAQQELDATRADLSEALATIKTLKGEVAALEKLVKKAS